jgi:hypothetical protein
MCFSLREWWKLSCEGERGFGRRKRRRRKKEIEKK